jgi:hypothetical protein
MDFDVADEMSLYFDYDEENITDFYLGEEIFYMDDYDYDYDYDDEEEESEGMITVNPNDLRFTQDSIAVCFQSPHENSRIDDTVDMIVSKKLSPKSFPKLSVVRYQGTLWSLDNRRLWVFRKAHVVRITVLLDPEFESHPRIVNLKSHWLDGHVRAIFPECEEKCANILISRSCTCQLLYQQVSLIQKTGRD